MPRTCRPRSPEEHLRAAGKRGHHAIAAAVVVGGQPEFSGCGVDGHVPDEHALFEIGSITKPLTGVLLADMHLRGEVDLADPLSRHLPGAGPAWPGAEPTLLDLATHRSGLPHTPGEMKLKEMAFALGIGSRDPWANVDAARWERLKRDARVRPPRGARIKYSNVGFELLGDALAAAAGRPYEDLLREQVLDPLGMHATSLRPATPVMQGHSPRGRPRPPLAELVGASGGLRSSTADMARFLSACLSPGTEPVGLALARAMTPAHRISRGLGIGLGWMIVTRRGMDPVVWHSGGTFGFRSFAGMLPAQGRAAVVLADSVRSVDRLGWLLMSEAAPRARAPRQETGAVPAMPSDAR